MIGGQQNKVAEGQFQILFLTVNILDRTARTSKGDETIKCKHHSIEQTAQQVKSMNLPVELRSEDYRSSSQCMIE